MRINDALRRQARLIDVAHEAILIRTIEGEISFWNQGAERIYGWSKEEALGRFSHELLNTRFPVPFDSHHGIARDKRLMGRGAPP